VYGYRNSYDLPLLKEIYNPIFQHGNLGTGMIMSSRKAEVWKIEEGRRHYDIEDEVEDEDCINQIDFKEAVQ
jgi:hypothetical protein